MKNIVNRIEYIILIAPFSNYHGQGRISLLVRKILNSSYSKKSITSINTFSRNSFFERLINNVWSLIKIYISVQKANTIYFTPSRNLLSSFKDFVVLKFGKKNKNTRIIAHLHGSDLNTFLNKKNLYAKKLKKLYLNNVDCFIILSETHKKFALGIDFNRYEIISNPLEEPNFVSKKNSKNALELCTISNPILGKGLDLIIKKLNSLNLKNEWILNVVGWTEMDYIKVYNQKPKFNNGILIFHGRQDGLKKMNILARSSFFIFLPSSPEAQPLTILEALSAKCIVIINNLEMMKDFFIYPNVFYEEKISSEEELLNLKNYLLDDLNYNELMEKLSVATFEKKIMKTFNHISFK